MERPTTPGDVTRAYLRKHKELQPVLEKALNSAIGMNAPEPLKHMAEIMLSESARLAEVKGGSKPVASEPLSSELAPKIASKIEPDIQVTPMESLAPPKAVAPLCPTR